MVSVVWCLRCARSRLRSFFSPWETRRDHGASLGAIIVNHNCKSLQNPYKTCVSFAEFAACKPIISLDPYKKIPRYKRRAFWPWAHIRQLPGFRNIPVDWFLHPLSLCTNVRFACKPVFFARRGYTYVCLFLHGAPRYDLPPSPVVQPPGSSSLQLYASVADVVVADCFDWSLRCSTRLYATTSRCCCFCCFCQVSSDLPG